MEELNAIINTLLTKDKLQKNIDENLLALFSENQNNKSLNLLQYTKNFENLAKYIFKINNFKKQQNNSGIGNGELLLQLLIGTNEISYNGDVHLKIKNKNKALEVKGQGGKLGKSILNSTGMTKYFIEQLKDVNIIKDFEYNGSCFGGTKKAGNNSQNVFNNFWKNIELNKNVDVNKIFECYIKTILHKYELESKINEFKNLIQNIENPFEVTNVKTLKIKENKPFVNITGFLYLCAYKMHEEFNYLIVFDKELNFNCLNCEDILKEYNNIINKFTFRLPGNTDDPENRSNVAVIGVKK